MQTTFGALTERMQDKMDQQRQHTEHLIRLHFQRLNRDLQSASENALHTTESAIAKQTSAWEHLLSSQCQNLESIFSPLNVRMLRWSCLLVGMVALTLFGIFGIFSYLATDLRQEITELRHERDLLENNYAEIWRQFKGLEPYEAEGKHYLLTGRNWKIQFAGIAEDKNANAWEIVRAR